ncbi:MAG: flagellar export protein FliJ [Planctomycetota bacterium]
MRPFRFRLEGLLRIRRVEESRRLIELKKRQRELLDMRAEIEALATERDRTMERLRGLEEGILRIEEVLPHRRYLNTLHNRTVEKSALLEGLRSHVKAAQEALDRASRERKAIERLRERSLEEHRNEERREEGRELDELARAHQGLREREEER